MSFISDGANTSRTIRVFISSTFRDMHAERDYLIRHIFPELRVRCKARQVEFVEVDLRWGITEKQAESGETLPRCLEIINTCRPYFIGILGERYGWVPQAGEVPESYYNKQAWLKKHRDKSVTELEILHGVLNNPEMAGRAFFYFRDPSIISKIAARRRTDFIETDEILKSKLSRLKQKIKESSFPIHDGYADCKALGKQVLEDLWQAIDQQFPATSTPDELELQALDHETFAASRTKLYTPRAMWNDRLDSHVNQLGPPLVITGESGFGKSALLANWAQDYLKIHSDAFIMTHFIGVSKESARPEAILRRIMGELKRTFPKITSIPEKDEDLIAAFPLILAEAASEHRIILIIDALNQLEDSDRPMTLDWLPVSFPKNVRLILSTTADRHLEEIRQRGWNEAELTPPSRDELCTMIQAYLSHYLKEIEQVKIDEIVAVPQASNPLFLRTLLDELRVTAIHDNLKDRTSYYLKSRSVTALFDKVLERWGKDYNGRKKGMVQDAMTFLAVSHRGLSERELLELLGNREKNLPLPQARWSPFYLAVQEFLVNRSGYFWFFHDHLRQAVERRYLNTPRKRCEAHSQLADFYSEKVSRDAEQGGVYRALALAVSEDEVACAEKSCNKRLMAKAYLNCSGTLISAAMGVADDNVENFDRMVAMLHKGCDLAEQVSAWDVLADGLCRRAGDETEQNTEFGSYDLIDRAVELRRKRGDAEGVRDALRDKARIGMRTDCLDVTEQSLREAEKIQRRLKKPDPQWTNIHGYQYWGECYGLQGKWGKAVEPLTQALKGARRFGHHGGITAATGWLGLAHCYQGMPDNGVPLLRTAMQREQEILLSQEGVGKWLMEIGRYFDSVGETKRALSALWLAELIHEELQHTALRRVRRTLEQVRSRDVSSYDRFREQFNPFSAEFAEYCSLWGLPPFVKSPHNPVLVPQGSGWENRAVFNPTVWSDGQQLHMLYRAEGAPLFPQRSFSSIIGHAVSTDGIYFTRTALPVLTPIESREIPGGCEDPRMVYLDEYKTFYLTYTAYDGITARLSMAICRDASLLEWEKLGPVFTEDQWLTAFPRDRYPTLPQGWSKSGALLPVRINGLYWMYFGDTVIQAACSSDLRTWEIVPKPVLSPRSGHFDASLVEPGPPPLLMPEGILLVYNGARLDGNGGLVYAIGQVLLDRTNPARVLRRSYHPILVPETIDELNGQTPNIVFAGGLTKLQGGWRLYYGMADSKVGVAVAYI